MTAGTLTFRNAANWTNTPGSVFEVQGGTPLSSFFGSGQFINQGTLRKTTAATAAVQFPVVNQAGGTIDVQQGVLQLMANGGSSAGAFDIASGATLNSGATFTLQAGATSTGAGDFLVAGGQLTVAGSASLDNVRTQGGAITANAPLTVGNLTLAGNLNGPADVTVNGAFTWTAGGMFGPGNTVLNGTSTIGGGSSPVVLNGRTINNAGAAAVTATLRPLPVPGERHAEQHRRRNARTRPDGDDLQLLLVGGRQQLRDHPQDRRGGGRRHDWRPALQHGGRRDSGRRPRHRADQPQ